MLILSALFIAPSHLLLLMLVRVVEVVVPSAAACTTVRVRLDKWCLLLVSRRVKHNLLARRLAMILPG